MADPLASVCRGGTGTAKPMKAPKKKIVEEDEDDKAAKAKRAAELKEQNAVKAQLTGKKGPLNLGGQGIKKSGK